MGQAEEIEARLRSRTLDGLPAGKAVIPDYLQYSICAVPGLVRTLFDGPGGAESPVYAAIASAVQGRVDRVILLVIDGLGFYHLASLLKRFPDLYLHSLVERGALVPITSVFPSTTVSALTTFSTGLTPQEHGMVGYRLYLRETSAITNMIRLSLLGSTKGDSAVDWGIDLETFLAGPRLSESLRRAGVETHVVLPRRISSSGLSHLLYGASDQLHPSTNLSDMLVAARRAVQRATGKAFVYLYWSETDSIAHAHGPESEESTAELRSVDAALGRELGEACGTVFMITSDHGFVTMERQDYARIDEDPLLMRDLVLPPVGEPRASYLFVREGRRRAVADRIAERFAGDLVCLDSHEALERGLFGRGDVHAAVPDRIGDLVVASTGRKGLYYPFPGSVMLKGMHGGLTKEEMLVPLIVSRL
jgi:hypothetical protein